MSDLELESRIQLDAKTIKSPNLCESFSDDDLIKIGEWCRENYDRNEVSRERWYKRTEAAMDLALQAQKEKSFPWQGCSNIVFPLITVAAMQFHSRAYPALIDGRNIVKCRVIGADPQGTEKQRAERVSTHMSWQRLEQDEPWEEEQDRGILNTAIVGCGFGKSFWDHSKDCGTSVYVHAKDLVMDYFSKSVESAMFKTHIIPSTRNELHSNMMAGVFRDATTEQWFKDDATIFQNPHRDERDRRTGVEAPTSNSLTPFTTLEHHVWLDLDKDGYAEPYIITTEYDSNYVLRIVTRFDGEDNIERNTRGQIIRIKAVEYFTKKPFIPSPDGGIYDIGFGTLLGPLNEATNAALNQMFDAGTLANTAGGFLGRGAKIRGGNYQFKPFGWNPVDSTGDDLRKNIFPLPVREPSSVMFNLLTLIIEYTNRISGTTEMMAGENPGQNTPAETSRTMIQQGQKIYSAIFKRLWRAYKNEFKKLYQLNALYLPTSFVFGEQGNRVAREDYTGPVDGICPAADPLITSDGEAFAQAQMIKEAAATTPGYNGDAVERNYLRALKVGNINEIFPGTEGQEPPEDVKVTIQRMKNEIAMKQLEIKQMEFANSLQETIRLNTAKIGEMQAKMSVLQSQAQNEGTKLQIEAFRASIELMRENSKSAESQMKALMEIGRDAALVSSGTGAGTGMEVSSGNPALV
jgi:chaperonin GroES